MDKLYGNLIDVGNLKLSDLKLYIYIYIYIYTGCNRRNGPDFGRVFLMLNYTEKLQNTYIESWEIMAFENCGLPSGPRTIAVSWDSYLLVGLRVTSPLNIPV